MNIWGGWKVASQILWFDKSSKAGNMAKISGQVVPPPLEDNTTEMEIDHKN